MKIFKDLTSTERGYLAYLLKIPLSKENPVDQIRYLVQNGVVTATNLGTLKQNFQLMSRQDLISKVKDFGEFLFVFSKDFRM